MRWGPGPVFVYETLLSTRRWQVYAMRSLYVAILLIGVAIAFAQRRSNTASAVIVPGAPIAVQNGLTREELAALGESFFYTMTGIQLTIVLLAAPAVAAGTICQDRARGTLLHMMVTDLSDAEIVLGKLGSRLLPLLTWLVCGIPVTAIVALLGGVDYNALFGAFMIAVTLGVLGCCMAMFVSVWAKKTHEVIMAVYSLQIVYLLALPWWWGMTHWSGTSAPPEWFQRLNPFHLAYEPYTKPNVTELHHYLIFIGTGLGLSVILTLITTLTLRRAVVLDASQGVKRSKREPKVRKPLFPWLPGPTLDGNPVLWREWHRSKPSRLSRILWTLLLGSTWVLAIWGVAIIMEAGQYQNGPNPLPFGYIFQIIFGLLFISATAPTALAEERVRSSLDVLLTTPLSTRQIVAGKWWGTFRLVLILLPLITFTGVYLAQVAPDLPSYAMTGAFNSNLVPLNVVDRLLVTFLCPIDFLVSGAMIVSIGLLIATWISRLGRAVAASVIFYLAITIGWPILIQSIGMHNVMITGPNDWVWYERRRWITTAISSLSPMFSGVEMIDGLMMTATQSRSLMWVLQSMALAVKAAIAIGVFYLTVATFDKRLGRVAETIIPPRRPVPAPVFETAPENDLIVSP